MYFFTNFVCKVLPNVVKNYIGGAKAEGDRRRTEEKEQEIGDRKQETEDRGKTEVRSKE